MSAVSPNGPASNEGLLRRSLLRAASAARFVPLDQEDAASLPDYLASVLLGMGEDGHFASLFPDAANLNEGLALPGGPPVIDVRTAASPHPRRSLTLARLLATDRLLLLAFGKAKRAVLEEPGRTPVATLLGQRERPLEILWAPDSEKEFSMHPTLHAVTERIKQRSQTRRQRYLDQLSRARDQGPQRGSLSLQQPCSRDGGLRKGRQGCALQDRGPKPSHCHGLQRHAERP